MYWFQNSIQSGKSARNIFIFFLQLTTQCKTQEILKVVNSGAFSERGSSHDVVDFLSFPSRVGRLYNFMSFGCPM